MRVISRNVLLRFAGRHPISGASLDCWYRLFRAASWATMSEIQETVPKAKVLNGERVRFEVAGGAFRMIVAFDFRRQAAFVKFIGTHAEYDAVDALTVSQF